MTAHDGVEQFVAIGDDTRGWNLSPDTGSSSAGSSGNFEDFFAGGNTNTQRAPLKIDANIALDTFRYGAASKGLDALAGSSAQPYAIAIYGAGNGNGAVTPLNDAIIGKVGVQGFNTGIPVSGIVSAAGEIPFLGEAFEGRDVVAFDLSANGDVDLSEKQDAVFAVVTRSTNDGNKILAKVGATKAAEITIGVIPAGEVRIYQLEQPANAGNISLEVTSPGEVAGYGMIGDKL